MHQFMFVFMCIWQVAVQAKFYNRSTGSYDTTFKASKVYTRKHQN